MFIRKIRKRNGRTKKIYEYLNLVESIRTENGPRQRLVLNLGNVDLHPNQYEAFAKRIEDILTGQASFLNLDNDLEKEAKLAARKILKKQSQDISSEEEADYKNIDINSLEVEHPRSLGAEYICHSIWKELGLNQFFRENGVSKHVIPLIEAIVVGRLVEPSSELHTKKWAEERSGIYELIGEPLRMSLSSYYRAGDLLFSLKEPLERYLAKTERDLFSLSEKIFFFDLSNTYFEGEALSNPKAKYGRSKEKRNDCKLVTLGLVIDETGFIKYSKVFPGNQSEGETLEEMVKELDRNMSTSKETNAAGKDAESNRLQTIVLDAGIANKDNLAYLRKNNYHYIVVNRGNPPFKKDYSDMEILREDISKGIKVEVKRYDHDGEAYILCKSEKKKGKEMGMRTRVEDLFLEKLEYYKKGLSLPRRIKKYNKVLEVIGRLKEKYPKAAKLYNVEVIPENSKSNASVLHAVDIVWNKKQNLHKEQIDGEGSYVLRTDRLDLSNKEIWEIYIMLTRIEYSFKCLKTSLGLRPNFHQKENRVDAHLFISVLAYHILNIVEYRLGAKGDNRTWLTINDILKTHQRMTVSFKAKDDDGSKEHLFIRLNSKLEPEHLEIYRKLNLNPVPLSRKKYTRTKCSDHNFP